MLRELHVSGLGVIEDLDLELHPGLNALTGETGAGKTMVTVALALALGRRASATLVRPGAKAARVEALFDPSPRAAAEGWIDAGDLVLSRSVGADGRSAARIGGRLAPVSALAELAEGLVELHGQHEGTRLLSSAAQIAFLDRFAGIAHARAVDELREATGRLRAVREAVASLASRERDREREVDVVSYQIREIEAAAPRPGELEALELERTRLEHAERLLERAGAAERRLAADGGAGDGLRSVLAELRGAAELDPIAAALAERAEELEAGAVELSRQVRSYREALELDPRHLEEVRERIAALQALVRKYGSDEGEVLGFLDEARRRLEELSGVAEERSRAERDLAELEPAVRALATAVSDERREAGPRLAAALEAELRELGMPGAEVEVGLVPLAEPAATGDERVELRFAAGPGQVRLPLAKVASGGELSRTVLACRSVLVDLDAVPTLVFDEVDAGIGGRAGVAVGRRLAELARSRQVLVVTHLPQIASFADRHVLVDKREGVATVRALDDVERVQELTRMLAGLPGSEAAATHAEELLAEAGRAKATGGR